MLDVVAHVFKPKGSPSLSSRLPRPTEQVLQQLWSHRKSLSQEKKNLVIIFNYMLVLCGYVQLSVCRCPWRPEVCIKCPQTEVIVCCELSDVGAGNSTLLPWNSNNCSQPQSHLSSPILFVFKIIYLFVPVCVQVWAHTPWCAREDKKTACWSRFSPSTTSLGLKLKASGFYQLTETSHQPLKHFLKGLQITK